MLVVVRPDEDDGAGVLGGAEVLAGNAHRDVGVASPVTSPAARE